MNMVRYPTWLGCTIATLDRRDRFGLLDLPMDWAEFNRRAAAYFTTTCCDRQIRKHERKRQQA